MVVVADKAGGLQTVNEGILLVELPVEGRRVGIVLPLTVKPDGADWTIVGEQFGQLVVHEFVILRPVGGSGIVGQFILVASQRIVQPMPVQVGIVEMQFDAMALAGVGKFLEDVTLEGGGIDDIIVADCTLEHRETVVMARGDGNIAGTGVLDGAHPLVGIKARGIEACRQLGILVAVDVLVEHDPLAVGEHRIDAPMDEDTKFIVLELLTGTQVLVSGNVIGLLGVDAETSGKSQCDGYRFKGTRNHENNINNEKTEVIGKTFS